MINKSSTLGLDQHSADGFNDLECALFEYPEEHKYFVLSMFTSFRC